MTDDDLDGRLREWAEYRQADAPAVSIPTPPPSHRPVIVSVAAAVALIVAVAVTVGIVREQHGSRAADRGPSTLPVSSTPLAHPSPTPNQSGSAAFTAASGSVQTLVLHDGETVTGVGDVVARAGKPVRFCDDHAVTEQDDPFAYCPLGVDVTGVDLGMLANRQTKSGVVLGRAHLTGTYRDHALLVTKQVAGGSAQSAGELPKDPPCTPPADGWPHGRQGENIGVGPVDHYKREHPGSIIEIALLRPSEDQTVVYVLTSGDPAPVTAALRPSFGDRLCVTRSRYTQTQIRRARSTMVGDMQPDAVYAPWAVGGPGLAPDAQPMINVDVPIVSQHLAGLADAQPAGLVFVTAWLAPAG